MRDQLIPRLQQTYDDLHSNSVAAVEIEAIVSALIEELEDINDAVENAKSSGFLDALEDPEKTLEAEMMELLKGLSSLFFLLRSYQSSGVLTILNARG